MSHSKGIIECLLIKGVNPTSFASNEASGRKAANALDYESDSLFGTNPSSMQYWAVDF